jgi:ubiquinol-cytochrome c reductase cytochrome c subunit
MRFSVRKLSTRRRHPLAGLVVLVMGLVVAGGLYAAFAPRAATAQEETSSRDVEAGRQLFLIGCASCHGKNATGVTTKSGGNYGPSLIGVGAASVDFQVGTGRMPMAASGPQAPRKDPEYTEEETRQLAAYVASLGPGPAVPEAEYLDWRAASTADLKEGGEFFRTNCTACHNFAGNGGALPRGRFAPSVQGVSEKHIYEAMLTGPQQMPVFSDEVLSPEDKRQIIAYLKKNEETPAYGGFTLGSLGPVSEGLWTWLIGVGSLIGFAIWIAANPARSRKKTKA